MKLGAAEMEDYSLVRTYAFTHNNTILVVAPPSSICYRHTERSDAKLE